MENLISLFIDDELKLDEKPVFVKKIHRDPSFYTETMNFLAQERMLRGEVAVRTPQAAIGLAPGWRRHLRGFFRPVAAAVAAACLVLWLMMPATRQPEIFSNRFVIYQPAAASVDIAGSFTDWERVPLRKIGDSGYWEITMKLTAGEHRFTYILEGHRSYADPTILAVEEDDFGGRNSILHVGGKA